MDLLRVSLAFLAILDIPFYVLSDSVPCPFSFILNKVAFIPECSASLWSWFSLNISSIFSCGAIFLPSYCHWLFFSSNLATL